MPTKGVETSRRCHRAGRQSGLETPAYPALYSSGVPG